MEVTDAATHIATGGAGVISMGYIAKFMIQNWIKKQDAKTDRTAEALQAVAVEMAKVGVRLEVLQKMADTVAKYGEAIAVLKVEMNTLRSNLNGLGAKVKEMGS